MISMAELHTDTNHLPDDVVQQRGILRIAFTNEANRIGGEQIGCWMDSELYPNDKPLLVMPDSSWRGWLHHTRNGVPDPMRLSQGERKYLAELLRVAAWQIENPQGEP